jgi:hypothetical protein
MPPILPDLSQAYKPLFPIVILGYICLPFSRLNPHQDWTRARFAARNFGLVTEWDHFRELEWARVRQIMAEPYVIVDGRNMLDPSAMRQLGFGYEAFGRAPASAEADSRMLPRGKEGHDEATAPSSS